MEKGKIEAYTLMEIAVAMLLAGVCISICYTSFGLIGNYFNVFEKKNNIAQTVISLRRTMDRDIQRSRYIIRTNDGISLTRDSLTVYYHFGEALISREVEGLRTDSFVLVAAEKDFQFEGGESIEGDTVDRVGFLILPEKGEKVPMLFKKLYSAQDLFR